MSSSGLIISHYIGKDVCCEADTRWAASGEGKTIGAKEEHQRAAKNVSILRPTQSRVWAQMEQAGRERASQIAPSDAEMCSVELRQTRHGGTKDSKARGLPLRNRDLCLSRPTGSLSFLSGASVFIFLSTDSLSTCGNA